MNTWKATQFELQTAHGRFVIMTGASWNNAVSRTWIDGGAPRTEWVGDWRTGYPTLSDAMEAVGAELARLDAGVVAVCTAGSEQLEACRKEVSL